MMKVKHINNAIQQYFRESKRERINHRHGAYIVVDDKKEAVELVERLFSSRHLDHEIVSAKNVLEAKKEIIQRNDGEDIKAIIIDLALEGKGENANGLTLAQWLEEEHSDIPYIVSTGRAKKTKEIERRFPGVDIFIKGKNSIEDFAEALGLNVETKEEEIIPCDFVEAKNSCVSTIIKHIFSSPNMTRISSLVKGSLVFIGLIK